MARALIARGEKGRARNIRSDLLKSTAASGGALGVIFGGPAVIVVVDAPSDRHRTSGRGLYEITRRVTAWAREQAITTGLLTLFCRHTSALLLIQENAAAEVRTDLEAFFEVIAPEDPARYAHNDEGPDDIPSHLLGADRRAGLHPLS